MPVPKRKTSKSRRDQRSSCKFIRPQAFAACSHCQAPVMTHVVCETCGHYKGRKILTTKLERSIKRGQARNVPAQAPSQAHMSGEAGTPGENS